MIVKFRKLHPNAVAPQRMTEGAAGFDLVATSYWWDVPTKTTVLGTGLAVEIPAGHVGLLFPRSSIYKTGGMLANCVGVIDSDYRGEIILRFRAVTDPHWTNDLTGSYETDDRIGQLVIVPIPEVQYVEVDELSDTARGEGGFGSSGK